MITSDNVSNFNEMKKFVAEVESGAIDLIIGTQMICKGYDFKNLTLIGVVDVDAMLYSSDFRANEKSFAMLSQLTGRVGRGDQDGLVLIQTYNPDNLILRQLSKGNRDDFYKYEIENRKLANLPPFFKMARLEIASFFESDCEKLGKEIKNLIKFNKNIEVSGPSPAMVPRVKNSYYYNIFLTVNKKINLQKIILDIKTRLCLKKNIKFRVDIDPN